MRSRAARPHGCRRSPAWSRRSPTCRRAARSRRAARRRARSAARWRFPTRKSSPATGRLAFMPNGSMPSVLEVQDLKTYFPVRKGLLRRTVGQVHAVDGVSFSIGAGETLGLVGESGCGKTTVGRTVLRLIEPTAGVIRLGGRDITRLPRAELRPLRREMQIIFQDPFSSLNPRMRAGDIVGEPLKVHGTVPARERRGRIAALFARVGLSAAQMDNYPHQFSGGQRQRIGVQRELGLSYLFISHNLAVVEHISHRIAVMYLGRIVEHTDKATLFRKPLHPYTEALLAAVPVPDPAARRAKRVLQGDVPSPLHPPAGCHFHTRCPYAEARCRAETPRLREVEPGHHVACHLR